MNSTEPRTHLATEQRYRADIVTGRVFVLTSMSHRSADKLNYTPPLPAARHGAALRTLSGFSGHYGDWGSAVTAALVPGLRTAGGNFANAASLYERAAMFVQDGWYDFQSATGPEAGQPSSHQHPITEYQATVMAVLLAEVSSTLGLNAFPVGWVLGGLVAEHIPYVDPITFPLFSASRINR